MLSKLSSVFLKVRYIFFNLGFCVAGGERRASALIYKYIIMYMYKYMYIFIFKYKYKFIYKYIYIVQTPAKNNIYDFAPPLFFSVLACGLLCATVCKSVLLCTIVCKSVQLCASQYNCVQVSTIVCNCVNLYIIIIYILFYGNLTRV